MAGLNSGTNAAPSLADSVRTAAQGIGSFLTRVGQALLRAFVTIGEAIQNAYQDLELARELAARHRWFITPAFPLDLIIRIVEMAKSANQKSAITSIIVEHFRADNWANLRGLVDGMSAYSIVSPARRKVLVDCVRTMQVKAQGFNPSNVVIPTLIAQLDGILSDFVRKDLGRTFSSSLHGGTKKELRKIFTSSIDGIEESALALIFDILLGTAFGGKPVRSGRRLNRHKILHGESISYGRVENAIRLFLMIDFAGYVIEKIRSADADDSAVRERMMYGELLSFGVKANLTTRKQEHMPSIRR